MPIWRSRPLVACNKIGVIREFFRRVASAASVKLPDHADHAERAA